MIKNYWGGKVSVYEFLKLIPNSIIYENPDEKDLLEIMNLGFDEKNKVIVISEAKYFKKISHIGCYILCFQEIEGKFLSAEFLFNAASEYYNCNIASKNKDRIIAHMDRIVSTLERISILGEEYIEKVLSVNLEDPISYIRSTIFKLKNWKLKKYDKDFGKFDDENKYVYLKLFLSAAENLFKKTGEYNITVYCKYVIKAVLATKVNY